MANTDAAAARELPLQMVSPAGYNRLLAELATLHLHPYDIKAGAIAEETGMTVILRFGEDHERVEQRFFATAVLERMGDELGEFFREAGKACREALIAGYYKMMKM